MNNISEPDFLSFQEARHAFMKWATPYEIRIGNLHLTNSFSSNFPLLTSLMTQSRILTMSINGIPHKLYSWTTTDNSTCGWLCQFEESRNDLPIIEEHNLLLQNIGGIIESYGSNERDISLNQHFLFTASRCERGLGSTKRFYEELCYNENINPIETDHLIAFAIEAGGNRTFYDPVTKNVLLYATDHSFDYVTRLPGQPDLTFYTINNVKTFTNYVELLARQWLDCVIK